jgi:dTDP-4-amino-4,6-dideoxygalactose transaminase
LDSGQLSNFGPYSKELEAKISEFLGVRYALCVSDATVGLTLLLNTLPPRSEVIVPSFTFLATGQPILWNSLVPVFADIDPETFTVVPHSVESLISKKTSAILAVNIFGAPCHLKAMEELAAKHNLKLFFDSAHALGSKYKGNYLGSFGDAEVFSLSATKLLACGEGGIITTNDKFIYQAILNRRNYGFEHGTSNGMNLGLNAKMNEFSAALGLRQFDTLDWQVMRRNEMANIYVRELSNLSGLRFQTIRKGDTTTYKDFTIIIDSYLYGTDKNKLMDDLYKKGIETRSYFDPVLHRMGLFQQFAHQEKVLLNTEDVERKILSLPIYPSLSLDDQNYIIKAIKEFLQRLSTAA